VSRPTDFLVPYLNQRAIPSLTRHYPADARSTSAYFSPAIAGSFAHLADAQQRLGVKVWMQRGSVELLRDDQDTLVAKMRAEGVVMEEDVVEGGVHLDAGIAFALGERRPESSWVSVVIWCSFGLRADMFMPLVVTATRCCSSILDLKLDELTPIRVAITVTRGLVQ
jgi:acetyl esterase/lipase